MAYGSRIRNWCTQNASGRSIQADRPSSLLPIFMACITNSILPKCNRIPLNLFDWMKGRRAKQRPSPEKYHDIDIPFSPSLVAKTHLRGNPILSYILLLFSNLSSLVMYFYHTMIKYSDLIFACILS